MSSKIIGVFTGLMSGYLSGMVLGFVLFNPDQDVWALLGGVLALIGLGVGLTPWFQRQTATLLMALIGSYFGTLIGIVLFGDVARDDLLEVLQRPTILVSMGGMLLGGWLGRRLRTERASGLLFTMILGGFLGGYLLGIVLHWAPYPSFAGWSPFVIVSGVLSGGLVAVWQRRSRPAV